MSRAWQMLSAQRALVLASAESIFSIQKIRLWRQFKALSRSGFNSTAKFESELILVGSASSSSNSTHNSRLANTTLKLLTIPTTAPNKSSIVMADIFVFFLLFRNTSYASRCDGRVNNDGIWRFCKSRNGILHQWLAASSFKLRPIEKQVLLGLMQPFFSFFLLLMEHHSALLSLLFDFTAQRVTVISKWLLQTTWVSIKNIIVSSRFIYLRTNVSIYSCAG